LNVPIPYTEWKQIKRWRKAVLPVLYRLGAEILRNFDRRYGGGKSALLRADFEVLAEIPDLEWKGNDGSAYYCNGEAGHVLEAKAEPEQTLPAAAVTVRLFDKVRWVKKIETVARPLMEDAIQQAFARLNEQIRMGTFDPTHPTVRRALGERAVQQSKFVTEGTEKIVQTHLRAGVRNGEGIPTIRDRIFRALVDSGEPGTRTQVLARAETIARTEVVGAHNMGNREAMLQSGAKTRIWVTSGDDLVRDTHAAMDGRELDVNKPWHVDGEGEVWYPCAVRERCSEFTGKMGR